jgi:hypothetical protein
MQIADVVRQGCIAAALRAYDDAGLSGLCQEGRWACAVEAMRALPFRAGLRVLLEGQGDAEDAGGTRQETGPLV